MLPAATPSRVRAFPVQVHLRTHYLSFQAFKHNDDEVNVYFATYYDVTRATVVNDEYLSKRCSIPAGLFEEVPLYSCTYAHVDTDVHACIVCWLPHPKGSYILGSV
jgi:hypothetical protein